MLLISIGRWTRNLTEQARLEALISAADTRALFYAARSRTTVLAERAFHALRQPERSPLPEGRCVHHKQTYFFSTINMSKSGPTS